MAEQMEPVKLPTENAYVPVEEARQPPVILHTFYSICLMFMV